MIDLAPGAIVVVPFPYSDRLAEKRRPALVVSTSELHEQGYVWAMMATSAAHRTRPFDIQIKDLARAGLPAPSIIRPTKIACIEPERILAKAGVIAPDELQAALSAAASFIARAT